METELFLVGGWVTTEGPERSWRATVLSRRSDGAVRVRFDDGAVGLLEPELLAPRSRRVHVPTIRSGQPAGEVVPLPRRYSLRRLAARHRRAKTPDRAATPTGQGRTIDKQNTWRPTGSSGTGHLSPGG